MKHILLDLKMKSVIIILYNVKKAFKKNKFINRKQ